MLSDRAAIASWGLLAGLGSAAFGLWPGCTSGGPHDNTVPAVMPPTGAVTATDVLHNMETMVVAPALDVFVLEVDKLDAAVRTWSAARSDATHAEARHQWRSVMLAWQYLELMQFGAVAPSYDYRESEQRNAIYSWPNISTCRVDEAIVESDWLRADFFGRYSASVHGLDALEYLLFYRGTENSCPEHLALNAEGTWDDLGYETVSKRRAEYAAALTAELSAASQSLAESWISDVADRQTASEKSVQKILDGVFEALHYLQYYVLNGKLCHPLALRDCTNYIEPRDFEHAHAGMGLAAVHQNLIAARDLFTGGSGAGFDDLLLECDEDELRQTFLAALDQAIAAADAVAHLADITPGQPQVMHLHDKLDAVITHLSDVATVLSLRAPQEGDFSLGD